MPRWFTGPAHDARAPHIRTDCSPHERSDMRGNPGYRLRLIRATEAQAFRSPTRAAFVPGEPEICYSMLSALDCSPHERSDMRGNPGCRKLHETHSKGCVPGCRAGD